MQQPFWGLFLVYPSEEAAWALGFRVGLEETTSAVNADRYEANDECHQSGGLPRRENHRGGEGIAISCASEAKKRYGWACEGRVASYCDPPHAKLTEHKKNLDQMIEIEGLANTLQSHE